jgi:hypothetical protein
MVRLSPTGNRRVLLGIGSFGGFEHLKTGVRAVASPETPYQARVRAALVGAPLSGEAGLATWIHWAVLCRLLHGCYEEQPTVERLVGPPYHVDLGGLLDTLVRGAMRCQVEGHPAAITARHCRILSRAADALGALRERLVAGWESFVQREIELGGDTAQAIELLDLTALYSAVGLELESLVFGVCSTTDTVQKNMLVLLRAAAAVRGALPQTPEDVQGRAPLVALFVHCARIFGDCRPSVDANDGAPTGFLDELRATERSLRAVRPRRGKVGRPRFVVEREVAIDLVKFLVEETGWQLLGHAAALLAVACPGLTDWRENALRAEQRIFLHDATLDAETRQTLGRCRPDALPAPSRTRYIANLAARFRAWLGKDLVQSLRPPERR